MLACVWIYETNQIFHIDKLFGVNRQGGVRQCKLQLHLVWQVFDSPHYHLIIIAILIDGLSTCSRLEMIQYYTNNFVCAVLFLSDVYLTKSLLFSRCNKSVILYSLIMLFLIC